MQARKEKNQKKVTSQTHSKTTEVICDMGVNKSTLYRDIKYLGIELIKDKDNVSWISNKDVDKIILLRKHIKKTGRRAGFYPEKIGTSQTHGWKCDEIWELPVN